MKIPFLDLSSQYKELHRQIDKAIKKVIAESSFILGEDVRLLEEEFARYCGVRYAVGVSSGTAALFLALLSLGIKEGDEVIVPDFTFIATAFAVSYAGAKPVFADIDEFTFNVDINKIKQCITGKTKAIIPVHLFGQTADMKPILDIAKKFNLKVIEDAAQAHGAKYKMPGGKWAMAGSMGDIGIFSFYPTNNLGGFGDGGMLVTNNKGVHDKLLVLRDCGRKSKYEHVFLGYNSRLDTVQAAVLRAKLKKLDKWNSLRRRNAGIYKEELKGVKELVIPQEAPYAEHVYHSFAVRVKCRDRLKKILTEKGVGTTIYYPIPLHLQKAYKDLGYAKGDFPVAEMVSRGILSLPMYPRLKEPDIKYVADIIRSALK